MSLAGAMGSCTSLTKINPRTSIATRSVMVMKLELSLRQPRQVREDLILEPTAGVGAKIVRACQASPSFPT
jgi:hypothetical protein